MTKDPYPSRVAREPAILPRQDPVLHAGPERLAEGPLGRDELARFERDGFLTLEGFLPEDEVRSLQEDLYRQFDAAASSDAPEIIREPGGRVVRSIFAVHRHGLFADLAKEPRLVRVAEQLLGGEVYIHQSRINFKPGFAGKEFQWHSDFETWHIEDGMPRMRALSMSIALAPNTPDNGPLLLIPGSHRHYVACVGETPDGNYKSSLRKQEYGVPDEGSLSWLVEQGGIAAATGPAGSITVFDCNTMHGSNSNITPLPRSNAFFVYNSVENRMVAPFGNTKPRPEMIATRDSFEPIMLAA